MFMYFLLPHWGPATWRNWAQASMRAELPTGRSTHTGAADLPVEPFNGVIGTDAGPVFTGKIVVSQRFLNAIFYFLSGLFQLHGAQLFHHGVFLLSSFLAFLGVDYLEYLCHSITLE